MAKISDKKIREIILEEVSRALLPESTIQDLGDLKSQAREYMTTRKTLRKASVPG